MSVRFFFSFLITVISVGLNPAQDINIDNELLPLNSMERVRYMNGYMESNNLVRSDKFDLFLEHLKVFAKQQNDELLLKHIQYNIKGKPIFYEQNIERKLELIKKLQNECQANDDWFHVGDCLAATAQVQFSAGQYASSFENLLAADEIFKKMGYQNVPLMGKYLHDFALDYFFFKDYEKAIAYMEESIKLPAYNENLDIQRYNTLGASYLELNRMDTAYNYFEIAYQKSIEYKDRIWQGLVAGNIGEVMFAKNNFQQALHYFIESNRINSSSPNPNNTINIAKTYLKLGDTQNALKYFQQSKNIIPKPGNHTFGEQQRMERTKENYYELASFYYLEVKDYKNAMIFSDSLHQLKQIQQDKYNKLLVDKASDQLKLLSSKMEYEKNELIHEKEEKIRNITILVLVFIIVGGLGLIWYINRNRKRMHHQKQLLLTSQLELSNTNLRLSEQKLADFAQRILEKTQLIEQLQQQQNAIPEVDEQIMQKINQITILTEEDWSNFKLLFEQVHSGFLSRLKVKYPQISPAETRFLSLAKLNFSTKEMAGVLGVSTQSIRTNWYRIRKKLSLPESMTINELIETI